MFAIDTSNPAIEGAFAQVLEAEQSARDAVQAARAQAEQIAEAARAAARAREERQRARIAHVRAAFGSACRAQLAAIAAEGDALALPAPLGDDERRRAAQAADALAAQLTGAP